MGRRGPAPKPAQLRLLNGARPDKVNQNEPIPRSARMVAPDYLSDDVAEIFETVAAELEHMRIAAPVDTDALVCFAEAVDKHRRASAALAVEPLLVDGAKGGKVRNPALAVQRDAANTIRQFAQEFGLTPSARARIESERPGDDEENPFAAGSG